MDVYCIAPKMWWIHSLISVSHFAKHRKNWAHCMRNDNKSPKIPESAMVRKWKSDLESVFETEHHQNGQQKTDDGRWTTMAHTVNASAPLTFGRSRAKKLHTVTETYTELKMILDGRRNFSNSRMHLIWLRVWIEPGLQSNVMNQLNIMLIITSTQILTKRQLIGATAKLLVTMCIVTSA